MRSFTSLAVLGLLSLSVAAPAPVAVSVPEITPAPTLDEVATATIEERQLLPNLIGGILGIVTGLLKDVDSAVAAGNPSACSSALVKIQPTTKPTAISQVLSKQASIWASPSRTNIYGAIATQVANGLGPVLDGTLNTALQGSLPVGENSISNNNKVVNGLYPKKSGTTDAPYSVPEANLRAAIFIPPSFTYGKKTPVLFVPGTGAYGGANFANNLRKLLTGQSYADPVWVNVPGAMLGDAQINSEYIAYAINYISAVSGSVASPKKIAVISWSQGGLDTQWVLKYWPSTRQIVQDFLPVSPDFAGTVFANALCLSANSQLGAVPCDPSVIQQQRTSNYVQQLRKGGGDKAFVPTTTFYSGFFDEIVEPQQGNAASAFLPAGGPNAPVSNNEVQTVCANQPGGSFYGHAGVLFNPITYALIVDALTHPGTTGQVSRINRQAVCEDYAAPGLDLDDVLATSGLIPVAGVLLLAYPQKRLTEPPLKSYATY
ncbi:alpha/beta-hydrolase [Macroventuria anomochaeta]|uniref:Alpha/beta-hydrolase n=1 Tax=Macroventuria anomochaeta TaxID=301207 RepID=A0ACB6RKL1_9PLEO|nr:alpha/beta-hydrolase [Macroventuria anomochaeta]KAF2622411.1 alpha/beta-hydrolase [Macroventuria anomochaeta]